MRYIVAVWMVGCVLLGLRALYLRNRLIGYLRVYYPDIAKRAYWHPWLLYKYPWFVYNRILAAYCREHNVEDPELDEQREEAMRATSTLVVWLLSMPFLFVLLLVLTYVFSR